MTLSPGQTLGALYLGDDRCRFRVWAPDAQTIDLHLSSGITRVLPLEPVGYGYFEVTTTGTPPGSRYTYILNGQAERPDPASRSQPDGVHGPSEVVDLGSLQWSDEAWHGLPLSRYVLYELHVGTFSEAGTFDGVIPYLDGLRDLGITAIEIMPIAQFPGERNWGYDGTFPFAAQNSYGGPLGLHRLVDACHRRGLAVVLDVVYNHLGPEGNYLASFGPYFTDHYRTLWGQAVNFDGPGSDAVRRYFIENALYWLECLHVDALRLDAIHAIYDQSARPFLAELADVVLRRAELRGRQTYVIAESDLNDPRVIQPRVIGGLALSAQWNDDFHHAADATLTGDLSLYARDFGHFDALACAFRDGYVFSGQFSQVRQRRHGAPLTHVRPEQLVVFLQNHDQIGNRVEGERLSTLLNADELKLAAATLLLSPFTPLLFMGEEYGETRPFQYFTDHSDPALVEAVREGRKREFAAHWNREAPDPQDPAAFLGSRIDRSQAAGEHQQALFALHRELLRLRRDVPALADADFARMAVASYPDEELLMVRRWSGNSHALVIMAFGEGPSTISLRETAGRWAKALDTADSRWLGPGSTVPDQIDTAVADQITLAPKSCVLLTMTSDSPGCVVDSARASDQSDA